MKKVFLLSMILFSTLCFSQVEVYVLDVGAGLCTVTKLPNGEIIVYDCGSSEGKKGKEGKKIIKERLPELIDLGSQIDLLILSHTDADHINSTDFLFDNYNIKKVLWTSYSKEDYTEYKDDDSETYKAFVADLEKENCDVVDLFEQDSIIPPGLEEQHDDVTIRYFSGFNVPQESWHIHGNDWKPQGYALNAVSITMQLEYKGKRIFYGGDAIGWLADTLTATDKYILENIPDYDLLQSEIMIVPHHGSWNGSSNDLIKAIDPEFAIFSAGTKHNHPNESTIERFVKNNSSIKLIGTNKDDMYEHYNKNNNDKIGDDEIHITISEYSELKCEYLNIQ